MTVERIRIFDTTLRDGEQAPGCSMTLREKLRIAEALAELNVDIIEAGFPAASPGDFESVKAVADANFGPVICGLARCNAQDIEKVHAAVKGAERHRIHVFVATSQIHREHKLKMAKEEIIKSAVGAVTMARELCDDVEFSPEDASRTELSYLAEVVSAAIEAGATTVNIPDTVGYTVPTEFDQLFRYLKAHVPGIDDIILSVHCHNDLGMAVANSLAAVGARGRCTWFLPSATPMTARKQWIAGAVKPAGAITVDSGAAKALAGATISKVMVSPSRVTRASSVSLSRPASGRSDSATAGSSPGCRKAGSSLSVVIFRQDYYKKGFRF